MAIVSGCGEKGSLKAGFAVFRLLGWTTERGKRYTLCPYGSLKTEKIFPQRCFSGCLLRENRSSNQKSSLKTKIMVFRLLCR